MRRTSTEHANGEVLTGPGLAPMTRVVVAVSGHSKKFNLLFWFQFALLRFFCLLELRKAVLLI
jgi:hypothetical protein